jgi:6-phosphofructokinase 1
VAEGAKPTGGQEFVKGDRIDSFGHKTLGGIGEFLAQEIAEGTKLEARCVVLSHLQRGGAPCAYDRRMGRYFGIAAVDLLVQGDYGRMVCYKNGKITSCPIKQVLGRTNYVDVKKQYDTERYTGRRTILGK